MTETQQEIEEYMLGDEEVQYSLSYRNTGIIAWLLSILGYGQTHWFVTDQRLLTYSNSAGGFDFQEIALSSISSVEYSRTIDTRLILLGIVTIPILIGIVILAWALFRTPQQLRVHASGGASISLLLNRGTDIDQILWYLPAQRTIKESE